ncbi:MAG: cysteine synthase A [Alphaproteobacteria bacterium]|nr:cysteine synthase A [Alphaproteobacteria bacterium]
MPFTTQGRGRIYNNIVETVGNTPLVRLNKLPQAAGCVGAVLAKLEFFNPLSSVKDRTALGMIEAAEREGRLNKDSVLVEPTSGNTGIGLAFIASVRGYKLILTMPENMSVERRKLLEFLGADIVLTPAGEGMTGSIKKAEAILKTDPNAIMLQQFKNPANPAIHRVTTALEIWNDTSGEVDVFVAGVGTGGTVQGVGDELKRLKPEISVVAIEPASSPVLSGGKAGLHKIQGIGANFVPDILDVKMLDEIMAIEDQESMETARKLAGEEGILCGISSGAAVAAALKIAARPAMKGKTVVALLPDSGDRYISTELFG